MPDIRCGKCGASLAPADSVCGACGEPVGAEQRFAVLGAKAEAFAADGLFDRAARTAETLLALPLASKDAKIWWRKRGAWLQRTDRPGAMDEAEAVLYASLLLDDKDDLSHQLWIDLLLRQGHLQKARDEYKRRLAEDPGDAVAQRHLSSLRLMDEMKAAPVPKSGMPAEKEGMILAWVKPTPMKMITVGSGILFCVGMLVYGLVASPHAAAPVAPILPQGTDEAMVKLASTSDDPMANLSQLMKVASDPWSNIVQILLYSAYLYWGWKEKRER
jgi:hypothetical protein